MNQHRTVFQKMGYLGEAGMGGSGKTYVVLSIHGKALAGEPDISRTHLNVKSCCHFKGSWFRGISFRKPALDCPDREHGGRRIAGKSWENHLKRVSQMSQVSPQPKEQEDYSKFRSPNHNETCREKGMSGNTYWAMSTRPCHWMCITVNSPGMGCHQQHDCQCTDAKTKKTECQNSWFIS